MSSDQHDSSTRLVTVGDVYRLIEYTSEKNIDLPESAQIFLKNVPLASELDKPNIKNVPNDSEYSYQQIVAAHSALSALTGDVTSESLKDSTHVWRNAGSIIITTMVIFFSIIAAEVMEIYFEGMPIDGDSELGLVRWTYEYVLMKMMPFLWGALGSCLFLLKKLSDLMADRTFRKKYFKGASIRIILGAVLGGVINDIIVINDLESGEALVGATVTSVNALAFLTGLSVKVVYGALEKLINVLVDKFNLKTGKSLAKAAFLKGRDIDDLLTHLAAKKLADVDTDKPEGRELEVVLKQLISKL
jgi:hypothetical protein